MLDIKLIESLCSVASIPVPRFGVVSIAPRWCNYAHMLNAVNAENARCRFIVYDFSSNGEYTQNVLIYYGSEGAPIKEKMLFAGSFQVKKHLTRVHYMISCTCVDEIPYDYVVERVKRSNLNSPV
jgi:hypothetical protein